VTLGGAEADDAAPPAFAVVAVVASGGGGVDALVTLLQRHTGRDAQHELEESLADLYLSPDEGAGGSHGHRRPTPAGGLTPLPLSR